MLKENIEPLCQMMNTMTMTIKMTTKLNLIKKKFNMENLFFFFFFLTKKPVHAVLLFKIPIA